MRPANSSMAVRVSLKTVLAVRQLASPGWPSPGSGPRLNETGSRSLRAVAGPADVQTRVRKGIGC